MRKSWVKVVLVSLLLGAVTNVAVAWSLAAYVGVPKPPARGLGFGDDANPPWQRPIPAGWPERPRQSSRGSWWCCTVIDQHASSPEATIGPDGLHTPESMKVYSERGMEHSLCVIEWGLPMRSLDVAWPLSQRAMLSIRLAIKPATEASLREGWPLPARFAAPPWRTHLPLNPVWPGFAVNTLFYGLFAAVLVFGPAALRRSLRRRRGQCLACGYDLAGLATCPECGIPRPAAAQIAPPAAPNPATASALVP